MKKIVFVRHGESIANAGGITMEHAAIPLSERGHRQAKRVADFLPQQPAQVVMSPMIRTHQTASHYCEPRGIRPTIVPSLSEFSVICPTMIAGLSGAERKPFVASYWADPDPHRRLGPNADTFLEFYARVRKFSDEMQALPDGTVVFGHGIWFGLLLWHLLGFDVDNAKSMSAFRRFQQGLPMPNCAVYVLSGAGIDWSIRADRLAAAAVAIVT